MSQAGSTSGSGGGSGNVVGPGSSTNGDIVIFSGTTGKVIADSGVAFPIPATQGGTGQTTYTTGDTLYASAANTLSKRAIGTNNQSLIVSGGVPIWGNPPGSMVLLSSQTASSSTTIDFTNFLSGTYLYYKIIIISVHPATDNVDFYLLFSTNNGSSYLGSNYTWARSFVINSGGTGGAGSTSDSKIILLNVQGNANGRSGFEEINFYPASTGQTISKDTAVWDCSGVDNGGVLGRFVGSGYNTTTSAVNALRFQFSSGNISSGLFNLYGIVA